MLWCISKCNGGIRCHSSFLLINLQWNLTEQILRHAIFYLFRLNLAGENSVSLSANHLQKLRLSFQLSTPLGHAFNPHQVSYKFLLPVERYFTFSIQLFENICLLQAFLKLTHETKVEHIFIVGSSGKQFTVVLVSLCLHFLYSLGKIKPAQPVRTFTINHRTFTINHSTNADFNVTFYCRIFWGLWRNFSISLVDMTFNSQWEMLSW